MPLGKKQERHGLRKLPEYQLWLTMKQRCHNPRCKKYPWYGARGIEVCPRWRDSFKTFLEDVGRRPAPGMEIDREDNDKGYEPGNVRWATRLVQNRNRRNTVEYEHQGRKLFLSQWAKETGVPLQTLKARLTAYNWTLERALTTPVGAPRQPRRA